jgi:hypothetical protein
LFIELLKLKFNTKKKNYLTLMVECVDVFYCHVIIVGIILIANLILSIIYHTSIQLGNELYSYPISNLQTYVFTDMKVILSSDKCP